MYITIQEAAKTLNVHHITVRQWIWDFKVESAWIGNRWYVNATTLRRGNRKGQYRKHYRGKSGLQKEWEKMGYLPSI